MQQNVVDGGPRELAFGGGLEGASQTSRELVRWQPIVISPDQQIFRDKQMADLRGRDQMQNDGYTQGAMQQQRDSIVGAQFRLNATPAWEALGATEAWAEEFQIAVETEFNLLSDSRENWFDAARQLTLTGLTRLAVCSYFSSGESTSTVEWIRQAGRPFSTAIQMVSPWRMSNPDGGMDTETLRSGKVIDQWGAPVGYWFRNSYPTDPYGTDAYKWKYVPARTPWGRLQVIHIYEPMQVGQNRGIADIVAVLKQGRMTSKFSDVTLQNAVVNATYAAAIESELPSEMVFQSMGAGQGGLNDFIGQYLDGLTKFLSGSTNIAIDGVKMPHLYPGTKLSMKPVGTPGGVGTEFEASLHRHIAAGLGISYEEYTNDYTKTNYSSFKGAAAKTNRSLAAKKKIIADGFANDVYALWMEEKVNATLAGSTTGVKLPLPPGWKVSDFYDPVKRAALLSCNWIGASQGQVDEMKETQAAILRIDAGLSTYEIECARLGDDFRKIFKQRSREQKMMKDLGLEFDTTATKSSTLNGPDDTGTSESPAPAPAPKAPAKKKAVKA